MELRVPCSTPTCWLCQLLVCCAGLLAAHATFERSPFPPTAPGTAFQPIVNPVALVAVVRPCGSLRHDRPFGLSELAGHAVVGAVPTWRGSGLGAGAAQRGTVAFRERAIWAGVGLRMRALQLGMAVQRLGWDGVGGAGQWATGWSLGMAVALSDAWTLDASVQGGTAVSPARGHLRLARRSLTGVASNRLSVRAGRPPVHALAAGNRLGKGLSLSGETRNLARDFAVAATLHNRLDLFIRLDTHPVLGRSFSGGLAYPCTAELPADSRSAIFGG